MKIAIHGKRFTENQMQPVSGLFELLAERGHEVWMARVFSDYLKKVMNLPDRFHIFDDPEKLSDLDLVMSIGGDGTFLEAISLVKDSGVPMIGVNTGRLGFLSNVSLDDIGWAVSCLEKGDFTLDKRSLIGVSCATNPLGEFNFALNEVTVHKKDTSSMIKVHTYVDEVFMNTYWADGLIVATPTGSTAYSLSCGGPIVIPGSENLVLNPIAPHNLNVRPMVIPNTNKIRLKPEGRDHYMLLTIDSQSYTIAAGEEIEIEAAPFYIHLAVLPGQDFFSTIRQKMMWGIDRRN